MVFILNFERWNVFVKCVSSYVSNFSLFFNYCEIVCSNVFCIGIWNMYLEVRYLKYLNWFFEFFAISIPLYWGTMIDEALKTCRKIVKKISLKILNELSLHLKFYVVFIMKKLIFFLLFFSSFNDKTAKNWGISFHIISLL